MQGGAAQNWLSENPGAGFSAEHEVTEQVETAKGSGGENRREEDGSAQGTAQAMKRDTVPLHFSKSSLRANSNSLRHFLPSYPTEIAYLWAEYI